MIVWNDFWSTEYGQKKTSRTTLLLVGGGRGQTNSMPSHQQLTAIRAQLKGKVQATCSAFFSF
jgi:hypothetical protein